MRHNKMVSKEINQKGLKVEPLELNYLERVLLHLCSLKLLQKEESHLSNKTLMIKSYLTQDPRFDGTLIDDVVSFSGDIIKVTLEIDISFPTKVLEMGMRKEVKRWKKFYHRFSKRIHQHLSNTELQEMCKVFKLSQQGSTDTQIAQKMYETKDQFAIQKIRRRREKADKYILEEKYIQIK